MLKARNEDERNEKMKTVRRLAEEAKEELKNRPERLPKPHFPDPATWPFYVNPDKRTEEAKNIFLDDTGE